MSAAFLPKVHIDAMLTAALRWSEPQPFKYRRLGEGRLLELSHMNADEVGTMLWRANYEAAEGWVDPSSVDYVPMPAYRFEKLPGDPDPLIVIGAVKCYGYQTGDDYQTYDFGEARGFVDQLLRLATDLLMPVPRPWEICSADVFVTGPKTQA